MFFFFEVTCCGLRLFIWISFRFAVILVLVGCHATINIISFFVDCCQKPVRAGEIGTGVHVALDSVPL